MPSPVSPDAAPAAESAPEPAPREPDDAWLRATAAAAATPRPVVDWTPEPTPPPVAAETPAPPAPAPRVEPPPAPPIAASPPAPAAETPPPPPAAETPDEGLEPPRAASAGRDEIPDVAALDTLLPDRTKGGSINPRR